MPESPGKILYIGHQWPEPMASAAGHRSLQILDIFREAGGEVHFGSTAARGELSHNLEGMDIPCHHLELNSDSFDTLLKQEGFDTVCFDRFLTEEQFGWRVWANLPGAVTFLDTQDLHSLRYSRQSALAEGREWENSDWLEEPSFYRELASIMRTDCTLLVSDAERRMLSDLLPFLRDFLVYLPMGFDRGEASEWPEFDSRKDFIFVGNGKHAPNLDAIEWLYKEIWPELGKELPEASLHIYGAYLPGAFKEREKRDGGIRIHGHTDDIAKVMQNARLQLVPLRFGAGIKGKILQGLSCGLPSLTTPVGAEGLFRSAGLHVCPASDTKEYIRRSIQLYQSPEAWEIARNTELEESRDHFQPASHWAGELMHRWPKSAPPQSTQGAVLRTILRHQAFDSYRYLSRWIAEKNRKQP